MKTLSLSPNHSHPSLGRSAFLLIPFVLACFAFLPTARAVCQEGCLPGSNTVLGEDALFSLTSGGLKNTAIGFHALYSNTSGRLNTATGSLALFSNTNGDQNTATGVEALTNNTGGGENTATGYWALISNTDGDQNTATGAFALFGNISGQENTATGYLSMFFNTTGFSNTATGSSALNGNRTGSNNTAMGAGSLVFNTIGHSNTAIGGYALYGNTTGDNNIAVGRDAGYNLTNGDNNIDIGNAGFRGEWNTIRIGTSGTQRATFIAGISEVTVAGGVGVIIDTNGQLGTIVSSERFKDSIQAMDEASEAILALKPVTFRYKRELDPDGIPQFGLVAEEVEKVNPDLVARDEQGKPYTVRYEAVNAMLLNEFLKEHRKVEQLEAKLAKQEKDFTARLNEQDAKIQQVNHKLEMSKSVLQTIAKNP